MHKDATNPRGKCSSDEIYQKYLARYNEEKERAASSGENRPKATTDKSNRTSILETVTSMDLREYTESGLSDKIGMERVSKKKQEDYDGILPCRRWPCEYRRRCKFLHVPLGKEFKTKGIRPKNNNNFFSGVSRTKQRSQRHKEGGERSARERKESE